MSKMQTSNPNNGKSTTLDEAKAAAEKTARELIGEEK